jgi:putative methyltransferase (TIGR04325 family)
MLDWGGGIGHYYLLSQNLVPALEIDYHCKDVPVLAEHGRSLFPKAHFYTDETCLERKYDFVLVSGSFQYSQDWVSALKGLAQATGGYLFITRLPIAHQAPSFVIVQRPYQYGYNTEYLGWCLNRGEFLQCAQKLGLELIREFVVEPLPPIHRAPEQPEHWGFLFRKE